MSILSNLFRNKSAQFKLDAKIIHKEATNALLIKSNGDKIPIDLKEKHGKV